MKLLNQKVKSLTGLERQKAHNMLTDMAERRDIELTDEVMTICKKLGLYEIENNKLVSFFGLTYKETPFELQTNGVHTYGWTVWDLIKISFIIKEGTLIDFNERETDTPIKILYDGALGFTCGDAICASFPMVVNHETLESHLDTFSQYIHLFINKENAEKYAEQHENIELISIGELIVRAKKIANFFF
ncbi:MAG: organomercurial lyase [Alcaligenaceae bacterium]|nr:organomercurial lyase [Alcaligenaceae bacterium]